MTLPPLIFPTQMPSSGGSLANRFLSLANAKPKTTQDGCGPSSSESFAWYDPESSCWKTSQGCLLPASETSLPVWPAQGMTRNGRAFRLPRLVPPISAGESSLWPTPRAIYGEHPGMRDTSHLTGAVQMWPTPTRSDGMGGPGNSGRDGGENLRTKVGGQLNPMWVEWLMGFPEGWTVLKD